MLGAWLLSMAMYQDPADMMPPLYPHPWVMRMAEKASLDTRRVFIDAAYKLGWLSRQHEFADPDDPEAFVGVVVIVRTRAIGRMLPCDPALKRR